MSQVRVMVVEDSRTVRLFLEKLIGQDPRLTVVSAVESGEQALEHLSRVSPDVISMDIRLPGMDGFEVVRKVMERRPTPVVICSASVASEELRVSMDALRAGALSVVEKPVGTRFESFEVLGERLCTQLAIMSQVKVVRRRPSLQRDATPSTRLPERRPVNPSDVPEILALGVVSSTGGPQALCSLLSELAGFPVPILLTQHITASFAEGFASWLGQESPLEVGMARDGEVPLPGRVHLAPPGRHLVLRRGQLALESGAEVCHQRPSGSVLLRSLADELGHRAAGVVLTGMGSDGCDGLLDIRRAGGLTIAQDEATSVVYGMPRVAAETGAAEHVLPVGSIAAKLWNHVPRRGEVA